ncbi:MAG: hypothetical protein AB7T10_06110 [bacterium]
MKSKYYSNKGDYLYRAHSLKSKKKKKIIHLIPRIAAKILFFGLLISLLIFGTGYFLTHSSAFAVKKVKIVVVNEKTAMDASLLSAFEGKNLNKIKVREIESHFDNSNSEYGVRSVKRELPSTLKVVLYRRYPMFLVNGEQVINNDLTVYKATEKCVNYIPIYTDRREIKSMFDIPGLPTIHKQLVKNKESVKSVEFGGSNIYVKLKNGKTVVLSAGQALPDLRQVTESEYRVLDFRFKNAIYVKK